MAGAAVDRLSTFNRRTLDVIAARICSYLSLAHERAGSLPAIRSRLLALHRTAVLRHDDVGAETLLNLLLRNYLADSLYDQVGVGWWGWWWGGWGVMRGGGLVARRGDEDSEWRVGW